MFRLVTFVVLAVPISAAMAAPVDSTAIDRQLFDLLKEVHNRGADLHNAGDPVAAYRLYQGCLLTVRAVATHRPEAQKLIDDGLKQAEAKTLPERARSLHATFADLRKALKPGGEPILLPAPTPTPAMEPVRPGPAPIASFPPPAAVPGMPAPAPALGTPTLWMRLGGRIKVEKAVDEFVKECLADAKLDMTRGGKYKLDDEAVAGLKRKTVGYLSSLADGDVAYTGRAMKDVHQGMAIKDEELATVTGYLKKALIAQAIADADVTELLKKLDAVKADFK